MEKRSIYILSIIMLIISSCKKDETESIPDNSNIQNYLPVSCFMYFYEEINEEGTFEFYDSIYYEFDENNLLYKIKKGSKGEYFILFYDSNNRIEKIEKHSDNSYIYEYIFTWENDKVIKQRYFGNSGNWSSFKFYYYFNSKKEIVKFERYSKDYNDIWSLSYIYKYEWENGNLIKNEYYSSHSFGKNAKGFSVFKELLNLKSGTDIQKNQKDENFYRSMSISYTYDNNKNPFYGCPTFISYTPLITQFFMDDFFISKNNPTSFSLNIYEKDQTVESNISSNIVYDYSYYQKPTKMTLILEDIEDIEYYMHTREFNYKPL